LTKNQEYSKSKAGIIILFLTYILMATACSPTLTPANASTPVGVDAVQLPEKTQFYIDESRVLLAKE